MLLPEGTECANVLRSEAVKVLVQGDRVGGETQERRWEKAPETIQEVSNSTQEAMDNTGAWTLHFTKITLASLWKVFEVPIATVEM